MRNMIMMEGKVIPRNPWVRLGLHPQRVSLRRNCDPMYVAGIFTGSGLPWADSPIFLLLVLHPSDLFKLERVSEHHGAALTIR